MTIIQSIKSGDTEAERMVHSCAHSAAPEADPDSDENGRHAQGADWLTVQVEMTGTMTTASITPWFKNPRLNDSWYAGDQMVFDNTTPVMFWRIEARGKERVCFRVDSTDGGASDQVKIWAGYSHDEAQG